VGKAKGETQANDLSRGPQENRSSATQTLGEGQATEESVTSFTCSDLPVTLEDHSVQGLLASSHLP
jgi:hypothetical protein